MIKPRSIVTKSVIYTFLIMIVPLLVLGAAGAWYFHDVIKQDVENHFLGEARTVAQLTGNYLDRAVLYLEGQAARASILEAIERNDTAALGVETEEITGANPQYYWTFITDADGKVIASAPYGNITGKSIERSEYAPAPLHIYHSFIGKPIVSPISGRSTFFVGTPIVKNNTTKGYLVGALDYLYYYGMLNFSRATTPGQCIFVVNESGKIIAHHDPSVMGSNYSIAATSPIGAVLQGKEGTAEYVDPINNVTYLGAYTPVPEYGWGVIVSEPAGNAYQPVASALNTFGALLLLLTLLAIPVALVVGRSITRPIREMDSAVADIARKQDISKADLSHLPARREDELGNLARNFKYMSERLSTARQAIVAEKNRADLYMDVMGHDINNLNQVILSYLEMIRHSGGLNPQQKGYLGGAIEATDKSASIIRNVRAIQSATTEKPQLQEIDLDMAIRECIAEMPRPEGKDITFRYTPAKGLIAEAVPGIKQAFCNVIKNAIKYSGPEVKVNIKMDKLTTDGKKFLATTITDDGNGIPDETKETLFTRFQTGSPVPPGKGLGLYAAKVLTEQSGGSIRVENRVPEDFKMGTRVIISLPAAGPPGE